MGTSTKKLLHGTWTKSNCIASKIFAHSLRISQIDVNPLPHFWVKENPADLSLSEISSIISNYPDQSSALLSPFRYKYAQLMFNALNCAIVTFLALFLVSGNYLIKVEFLVRSIYAV